MHFSVESAIIYKMVYYEFTDKVSDMKQVLLLVDDNTIDLTGLKEILSKEEQYDVISISSAKRVLSYVEKQIPNLLIIGIGMNNLENLNVLESVRIRSSLNSMPILVVTDNFDEDMEERCFAHGAFDYVANSASACILKRRVEKALDYSRSESFREASERDYLTGVNNRRFAEKVITEKMDKEQGTFFLVDIDNFKHINDIFGHAMGDEVLRMSADILKDNIMPKDVLFRLGGDEFGIYTSEVNTVSQARQYAGRFIDAYNNRKQDVPYMRKASLSIGAAIVLETDKTFEDMYIKADKALYFVKQNGRNSFYCYNANDDEKKRLSALGRKTELQRFADLLTSYQNKNGVFEVGYREFENVFEMASRFTKRNDQKVQLLLFTLVAVDDEEKDAVFVEDTVAMLGDTINRSLRRVDICVRFSTTQFLVALIDTEKQFIEVVTDRIMQGFYKVYKGKEYIITYDIADIK